jgi:hypothetical protein
LLMSCPERRNELEAVLVALADEIQLVVERWGEESQGGPCPWTP